MKKKLNCVLLVDDDESDNFFHTKVLEKSGIANHIEVALNGREALDYLTAGIKDRHGECRLHHPDLIFLDINMPVMDGWEFLAEYQKLADNKNEKVVIIILTTSLNPADKTRAEKFMDGTSFQFKPLTPAMIRTIVKMHFPDCL